MLAQNSVQLAEKIDLINNQYSYYKFGGEDIRFLRDFVLQVGHGRRSELQFYSEILQFVSSSIFLQLREKKKCM